MSEEFFLERGETERNSHRFGFDSSFLGLFIAIISDPSAQDLIFFLVVSVHSLNIHQEGFLFLRACFLVVLGANKKLEFDEGPGLSFWVGSFCPSIELSHPNSLFPSDHPKQLQQQLIDLFLDSVGFCFRFLNF